jgi:TolB-like protein/Tfp pilus assembly protein PilF
LRSKLKSYYDAEGRDDPLIVHLPSRSYSLVFKLREEHREEPEPQAGGVSILKRVWRRKWVLAAGLLVSAAVTSYVSYSLGSSSASHRAKLTGDLNFVAVLPFVNTNADPEVERFSDGLAEELIQSLGEIDGFRVVSQASAFQFKGTHEDVRTIAAKLNVGVVLEGAVHRSGNRLRITTRLLNPAGGYTIYSHVYERELEHAFAVRREIAGHVANALRVRQNAERQVARFTTSADAHLLYFQGLYHARRTSESELSQAIDYYQRAIRKDPNYAPAYASLADAYILLALLNEAEPSDAMKRAEHAARSAVRTGDTLAHAHSALASVLALYSWDWAAAKNEFHRAIELDPNDSHIRQQYAMRYLVPHGNFDSALFDLQLAEQMDHFSANVMLNRGRVHYFKRDFTRAVQAFRSATELDQEFELAPLALAEAYLQSSSSDEAFRTLREASAPTQDEARLAVLGHAYALSQQPERARQVLQQLAEVARHQYVSGYYFALVHLALGETIPALEWLERAAEDHSPLIVYVNVAPEFDSLRAEPRFQALLKRVNIKR